MWQTDVIEPATAAGMRPDEILGVDFGDRMSALSEQSVIAMYHLQQTRAWGANLIEGVEAQLAAAGLHSRLEHPPAMCFLDLTGLHATHPGARRRGRGPGSPSSSARWSSGHRSSTAAGR